MLDGWIYFSLGLLAAYGVLMAVYWYGWRTLPVWRIPEGFIPRTRISVVIAARNEECNITACLRSILANDYPEDLLEIVVADDHSTDNTGKRVREIATHSRINIRLVALASLNDASKPPVTGKKRAITEAVHQARGELVVTTDADCEVPSLWLKFIASAYEIRRPVAICGPVLVRPGHTLLQHFEALDTAGTMGITGAGIHQGWQHLGNGAHLAYPKAVFEAVGGFSGNETVASGDDLFLLQKIARRWPRGVFFLKNTAATVVTAAQPDGQSFIRQRLRWGTKNKALPEVSVKLALAVVFLFSCSIGVNAVLAGFLPRFGWVLLSQLAAKAVFDYWLLSEMCSFFQRKAWLRWFWPSFFMHIVYISGMGLWSLFARKYEWKARQVE